MKKFSLLIVLILTAVTLVGCTNKVTLNETLVSFTTYVAKTEENKQNNEVNLFAGENFDLFSAQSYHASPSLYNYILQDETVYSLLNKYSEYETLLTLSNCFFNEYKLSLKLYENEVSQDNKTQLFNLMEEVKSAGDNTLTYKNALIIICGNNFEKPDDITILSAFKKYLSAYSNLIGKVINLNIFFEKVYLTEMANISHVGVANSVPDDEIKRLTLSSTLALCKFIYNKHLVYNTDNLIRFNNSTEFVLLNSIRTKTESLNSTENKTKWNLRNSESDFINFYSVGLQRHEQLLVELNNYEKAVSVLNHRVLEESDYNYTYYKFFINFDTTANSYGNFILFYLNLL